MKTPLRGLYLLVDEIALPYGLWPRWLEACLDTQPALVQYRAKNSAYSEQLEHAATLLEHCKQRQIPLLINDNIDLALQLEADGVHLGKNDDDLVAARCQLGPDKLIGSSCYSDLNRAEQALQAGANYVSFGRLFPSQTKPQAAGAKLSLIAEAHNRFSNTICAIGGINASNAQRVRDAGADLICVAGGIWQASDPVASCRKLATICA